MIILWLNRIQVVPRPQSAVPACSKTSAPPRCRAADDPKPSTKIPKAVLPDAVQEFLKGRTFTARGAVTGTSRTVLEVQRQEAAAPPTPLSMAGRRRPAGSLGPFVKTTHAARGPARAAKGRRAGRRKRDGRRLCRPGATVRRCAGKPSGRRPPHVSSRRNPPSAGPDARDT